VDRRTNSVPTIQVLIHLWDAEKGVLKSTEFFEVTDATCNQFSPNGHFLAVGKRSEEIIELWNIEVGKKTLTFAYPYDKLSSIHFSLTGDSLMAVFPYGVCIRRLDTQEIVSFNIGTEESDFSVIHSPFAKYLFICRFLGVEVWKVVSMDRKPISALEHQRIDIVLSDCLSCRGDRLLVDTLRGIVKMWNLDLQDLERSGPGAFDIIDRTSVIEISQHSGKVMTTGSWGSRDVEFRNTAAWEVVGPVAKFNEHANIAFSPDDTQVAWSFDSLMTICSIMHLENRVSLDC